jgi:hypothetical protein
MEHATKDTFPFLSYLMIHWKKFKVVVFTSFFVELNISRPVEFPAMLLRLDLSLAV